MSRKHWSIALAINYKYYPMEGGPLVAESLLARTQRAEVLARLWHIRRVQLHHTVQHPIFPSHLARFSLGRTVARREVSELSTGSRSKISWANVPIMILVITSFGLPVRVVWFQDPSCKWRQSTSLNPGHEESYQAVIPILITTHYGMHKRLQYNGITKRKSCKLE